MKNVVFLIITGGLFVYSLPVKKHRPCCIRNKVTPTSVNVISALGPCDKKADAE